MYIIRYVVLFFFCVPRDFRKGLGEKKNKWESLNEKKTTTTSTTKK